MGHRFLEFLRPRRAGGRRFLARARALFSQNHMNVRPILVDIGFAMISRRSCLLLYVDPFVQERKRHMCPDTFAFPCLRAN